MCVQSSRGNPDRCRPHAAEVTANPRGGCICRYVDTDMSAHITQPKTSPQQVVDRTLAGLESGVDRIFADDSAVYVDQMVRTERAALIQDYYGMGEGLSVAADLAHLTPPHSHKAYKFANAPLEKSRFARRRRRFSRRKVRGHHHFLRGLTNGDKVQLLITQPVIHC